MPEEELNYKSCGREYLIARRSNFSEDLITGDKIVEDPADPHYRRFRIEKRNQMCQYCNALMWFNERVKSTSRKNKLVFAMCCNSGKVQLPELCPIDPVICGFLTDNDFASNNFSQWMHKSTKI